MDKIFKIYNVVYDPKCCLLRYESCISKKCSSRICEIRIPARMVHHLSTYIIPWFQALHVEVK